MALDEQKPPRPSGVVAYSEPPASITSASPCSMVLADKPIQWVEVAHAVTTERLGPVIFCKILALPETMLIMLPGIKKGDIHIIGNNKINNINIKTAPYPGFPTDLQAQIMVLLCKANKSSIVQENIFENRFMHVAELNRMGAKISIKGNKAISQGNINFAPAELMATDLRASVSLILAALTARGKSIINRIYHLDRGYENIEKKLKKIGAKIRRVNQ